MICRSGRYRARINDSVASGQPLDAQGPHKRQIGTQMLLDTYQALYGPEIAISHLDDLAKDLSQIAGRNRPWTGKYLHSIIKGYDGFSATDELVKVLTIMASCRDGADEIQARAHEVDGLLAVHDLPTGTIVLGQAQQCANPRCPLVFVATHPRQIYHSAACAAMARRDRKPVSEQGEMEWQQERLL